MPANALHNVHVIAGVDVTPWMTGPPPATGQLQRYPGRFLHHLSNSHYLAGKPLILEMFSGASALYTKGYRVLTTDIRPETGCDYVAPYDDLPIIDDAFDVVLADPPYNMGFANQWITHSKDLPKPKRILGEAARVVKAGGLILILHIIVIPAYKIYGVQRLAMHPIFAGPNNALRVLNVFRKL